MDNRSEASRAALGILGTRLSVYPFKIVVALVVAPLLGTADYGIYSFLLLPGSVFMPLLFFGLGQGIRYNISSGRYRAKDVAISALAAGLFHGALNGGLVGLLWHLGFLGETGDAITLGLLLPILFVMPLQGAALLMNRVMVGDSWFTAMNAFILLNNLFPPVFLTIFVIVAGFGVSGAAATIVIANGLMGLISVGMVVVRYRPRIRIHRRFLMESYSYGLRAWVGSLASRTTMRLDQFVLGFVRPPEALGVYRIAVLIGELLWMIPDAVALPLFNRVSKTVSGDDRHKLVSRCHRVLIVVVAGLAVVLAAACWWLIPAFMGAEFTDARWILLILMPGTVSLVTSRLLSMYFSGSGQPEKSSSVEVVGAVVSIAGYLFFIPILGIAGAAIATSIAYIVLAATAIAIFRRTIRPANTDLYRTRRDDIVWAKELIRDSFAIWARR